MTLVRDARELSSWLWQATRRVIEVDRRAALRLILSMGVNQVLTVLVFLLPLKVVLLIASDGVPKYFKFFITEETRSAWLIGLATAIIVLYLVSLRLERVADRSATEGAKSLFHTAEQVPITSNPEEFAKTTFYRIGEIAGGVMFSVLALVVAAVISPPMFLVMSLMLLFEFLLAAVAVGRERPSRLWRFGEMVRQRPQNLLKSLADINFLTVFAVLLGVFLLVEGLNPLVAIAVIMLSRRLFGALQNVVRDSLKLAGDRNLVDALLFAEAQVKTRTETERERLLGNALPSVRLERLQSLSATTNDDGQLLTYTDDADVFDLLRSVEDAVWVDSGQSKKAIFDLYGQSIGGERQRLFREYLYSGKASRGLEQHDFLVKFLSADALRCPARVLGYSHDGLVGRIVDFRGVAEDSGKRWKEQRAELLHHLWSLEVPESLVEAYESAHPRLHQRLGDDLLSGLRVATDEPWARAAYEVLSSRLSDLCERVAELPLMLFNERLTKRNVVVGKGGASILLDWTSWTLQPIGAGFAPDSDPWELLDSAHGSARQRAHGSDEVVLDHVLFASLLHRVDRLVRDGYPKTALSVAARMRPLLDDPEASIEEVKSAWQPPFGAQQADAVV